VACPAQDGRDQAVRPVDRVTDSFGREAGDIFDRLDRAQHRRRLIGAGLLTLLVAAGGAGVKWQASLRARPLLFLLYWGGWLLLFAMVIAVAVADLYSTLARYRIVKNMLRKKAEAAQRMASRRDRSRNRKARQLPNR